MATTVTVSNHAKYKQAKGEIDFSADAFKCILCTDALTFNKDTHATYADVSATELSTGNGYTEGGAAMTQDGSLTEDDTDDIAYQDFADVEWTAATGSIGPFRHAIVYDDDTSDDTVIACFTFDANITVTDGNGFLLRDARLKIS